MDENQKSKIKNQYKKLIVIVLTASIIITSFSSVVQISAQTDEHASIQVTAEDGSLQTESKPIELTDEFIIRNKDDFSKFMTTTELWGSNCKVTLACDIDMKGKAFNSIKEFDGVFDGCGHTVSNFKIQNKSGKGKNSELALINILEEYAEIKNITFDNYTVEGKFSTKKAAGFIITNHGTVSGVDIINSNMNNIDKKVKSAGFVLDNEEDGLVENCHMENMTTKDSKIISGFVVSNAGKITKCCTTLSVNNKDIASGFVSENFGIIENCNFKGEVSSKKCAGGFCGSNSGEIISCKAEGNVTAKTKSTKLATICGGFVGENSGIIKDSNSSGKVEGQEFTGGFVGINNDKGEISSCKATCDVKSHTNIASIYCGGFVGLDAGKIEDCTFDGKVDGCVDSEKMIGGVVVASIITIAIITIIVCLLIKYFNEVAQKKSNMENANKEYIDVENIIKNEFDSKDKFFIDIESLKAEISPIINENGEMKQLDPYDNIAGYYLTPEYIDKAQKIININNEYIKALFNKDQADKEYSEAIEHFFKSLPTSLLITFIVSCVGGVASGVTTRCMIGSKHAYIGAFSGYNIGDINKCNANSNSLRVKTLYNKYNMCGGFIGVNAGTIKDSNITSNKICNEEYTGGYLGGFVGENSGKIENGTTTVSVTNGKFTGGFCGKNSGEILNSKAEGNVTVNAKTIKTKCGGFVGNNKDGKINGCISKGSVTGKEYVGGFCGDNTGEIVSSKSEGDSIAKTVSNTSRCGGFVGLNSCIVKDSSSTGSATGQEYVGGFCGDNSGEILKSKAEGNAKASTKIKFNGCGGFVGLNSCIVKYSSSTGSATGQNYVGGFCGYNKGDIVGSKSKGNAIFKTTSIINSYGGFVGVNFGVIIDSSSTGDAIGQNFVGGFCGYNGGKIINCTSTGGADSRSNGYAKAGGFVGVNRANITNSKASGKVYLSAGALYKDDGCGGFVGRNDQGGIIDGCYAECTIETTNKKKGGGFVGEALNKSTINNSKCKTKIITKSGIKKQTKFYEHKDKKAVIENCYAN